MCWSTSPAPNVALPTKTNDGSGNGTFTSSLTGLTEGITYYVRSYATNAVGTSYGNEISFITDTKPTLFTTTASSILAFSASSGGTITSDGGAVVTVRGVCWSTSPAPTVALLTKTSDGSGTGSFTSSITGLAFATKYYVRTYATNAVGTSYGSEVSFTTLAILPTLSATASASAITGVAATSGGNITADGGAAVTVRGVCWSTSPTPTVALSTKTSDGSGTGSFTSNITGLAAVTKYYMRSYATNSVGTNYGNEVNFTTLAVLPTLSTIAASAITTISATSGGTITNDGGAAVTVRGVCWSTSPAPTVALATKTSDGSGTGSFTSSLTGLTAATKYYIRSYATNAVGTSYGAEVSFTTLGGIDAGTVTDIDGNVYHAITLGTQTWMVENLKTTKYRDGSAIANVTDNTAWSGLTTGAYCWYNNDVANKATYGAIYNWYAVNTAKLAPTGWHVPTNAEWTVLENYLIANGYNYDGTTTINKISKSLAATTLWNTYYQYGAVGSNRQSNNTSGFTAVPAGWRSSNGSFYNVGNYGYWWSSVEIDASTAWYRYMSYDYYAPGWSSRNKSSGFSVRCVRD